MPQYRKGQQYPLDFSYTITAASRPSRLVSAIIADGDADIHEARAVTTAASASRGIPHFTRQGAVTAHVTSDSDA